MVKAESFGTASLCSWLKAAPPSRLPRGWNVRAYSSEDRAGLVRYVENPPPIALSDDLLAGAKDAYADGDQRRTILFLAIACEVAVKHALFDPSTQAGDVFAYLEQKALIKVGIRDLLKATRAAFGEGFPEKHGNAMTQLDLLFQCRDRIAHHGRAEYRDVHGDLLVPTRQVVTAWWEAVAELMGWLRIMRNASASSETNGA